MLRRKATSPLSQAADQLAEEGLLWDTSRDVPPSKEELSPKELMARLTLEVERKMDAAFGRPIKNSN